MPTPTTHPFNGGGINSEVHNAGEVWTSALWEAYVALQKAGNDFIAVRNKMAQYVVAQPAQPAAPAHAHHHP